MNILVDQRNISIHEGGEFGFNFLLPTHLAVKYVKLNEARDRHKMSTLLHELIFSNAVRDPEALAVGHGNRTWNYSELASEVRQTANAFSASHLGHQERVAVYLPKRLETVVSIFGATAAGAIFVPVNPLLKPIQVAYILRDCNVRILVTTQDRANLLAESLSDCHDLHTVVVLDSNDSEHSPPNHFRIVPWDAFLANGREVMTCSIDSDIAAILYTSGSTGNPKGVVLSHRNLVAGARSVSTYLQNSPDDRLLAVLPFSFDYGLSQLTTAFSVGASCFLMDYLLPRDVLRAVARYRITGLAAVPPLWVQLAQLPWPAEAVESLRYITNSGGAMPTTTLQSLRDALPHTKPFLMYGLTEAFRSTFLPPDEVDRRPDSIGKAIPNAEILVVREDGTRCAPGEPGELVHRGALVAMGYWADPERTKERFRPSPEQPDGVSIPEIAVWSGDTVRMDEEGFLYFVGRKDDMIKTSGYRVSPSEIEEVIYSTGLVVEAAAIGVPHPVLGQAIVVTVTIDEESVFDEEALTAACRGKLANYMVPHRFLYRDSLPRNPNGKIDRKKLANELYELFEESTN